MSSSRDTVPSPDATVWVSGCADAKLLTLCAPDGPKRSTSPPKLGSMVHGIVWSSYRKVSPSPTPENPSPSPSPARLCPSPRSSCPWCPPSPLSRPPRKTPSLRLPASPGLRWLAFARTDAWVSSSGIWFGFRGGGLLAKVSPSVSPSPPPRLRKLAVSRLPRRPGPSGSNPTLQSPRSQPWGSPLPLRPRPAWSPPRAAPPRSCSPSLLSAPERRARASSFHTTSRARRPSRGLVPGLPDGGLPRPGVARG
mmetsp:Transcript_2254/g.4817  ORF Transcript_2254/g.4817 Transcript_2254/m.4817 type:complete len:252 (-) Transcript_2254:256-1011(-)